MTETVKKSEYARRSKTFNLEGEDITEKYKDKLSVLNIKRIDKIVNNRSILTDIKSKLESKEFKVFD